MGYYVCGVGCGRKTVEEGVKVRLTYQEIDEFVDDSFERRIGHGEDNVTGKKQGARHSEENVAEIIENALFHLCARVIRRADAENLHAARLLGLIEAPGTPLGGVVRSTPAEPGDVV